MREHGTPPGGKAAREPPFWSVNIQLTIPLWREQIWSIWREDVKDFLLFE
jgi:hypothetical protein